MAIGVPGVLGRNVPKHVEYPEELFWKERDCVISHPQWMAGKTVLGKIQRRRDLASHLVQVCKSPRESKMIYISLSYGSNAQRACFSRQNCRCQMSPFSRQKLRHLLKTLCWIYNKENLTTDFHQLYRLYRIFKQTFLQITPASWS